MLRLSGLGLGAIMGLGGWMELSLSLGACKEETPGHTYMIERDKHLPRKLGASVLPSPKPDFHIVDYFLI